MLVKQLLLAIVVLCAPSVVAAQEAAPSTSTDTTHVEPARLPTDVDILRRAVNELKGMVLQREEAIAALEGEIGKMRQQYAATAKVLVERERDELLKDIAARMGVPAVEWSTLQPPPAPRTP